MQWSDILISIKYMNNIYIMYEKDILFLAKRDSEFIPNLFNTYHDVIFPFGICLLLWKVFTFNQFLDSFCRKS